MTEDYFWENAVESLERAQKLLDSKTPNLGVLTAGIHQTGMADAFIDAYIDLNDGEVSDETAGLLQEIDDANDELFRKLKDNFTRN